MPVKINYGDPIYKGPPTEERIKEIKRRYYFDEYGKYGPNGRLYLDNKPYLNPKLDQNATDNS